MHAVKNGIIALGISACLSSTPVIAQSPTRQARMAPQPGRVAPAVAYDHAAPGAVRQVAGRQPTRRQSSSSGGLLGGFSLFERLGIGDEEPAAHARHNPGAGESQPDWSGVPFHRPQPSNRRTAAAPITDPKDPSNRAISRQAARTARATANPQIPVPPAEVAKSPEVPAAELPKVEPEAPVATGPKYGALSLTESSRRSGRRVVDPLDSYLNTEAESTTASPVRADGHGPIADRGLADGPRVARRPVPPVNNAATSRRAARTTDKSMPPSLAAADGDATAETGGPTSLAAEESAESVDADSPQTLAKKSLPQTSSQPSATTVTNGASSTVGSSTVGSSTVASSGAAPSPAGQGEAWQASSATQPQLGVRALEANDSVIDPSQTTTTVNAQPINVVAEIPGIRVVTSGPAEIAVRQAAKYEIRVENRGAVPAPGALVRITLPRWIEIQSKQVSRGEIEQESDEREQQLLWQVAGLPAASVETMTLAVTAAQPRQFDVAVEWAVLPQSNVAHVQVNEPKLELVIDGPDQVVYGESKTYKVRVLNPGTGTAQDVVFTLSPDSKSPQSQRIGSIPAGKEAHFEVELTARDRENLKIHGMAIGAAGLESELTKSIDVLAAELEAVLSGPPLRYQASSAAYKLEITNRGDAPCQQMTAVLQLPAGVQYEGGLPEIEAAQNKAAQGEAAGNILQWPLAALAPGESVEYEFQCLMQETGEHRIGFECQGSAAGAASVAFTTTVETLADLVLAVVDPAAPAPVGEDVKYEIVIRNRGSKAAADVQVLAQFSHDVEPLRAEGAPGKVAPGQVVFDPIPSIEPGQELRLTVVAKADKAGLHRFRTEVSSGEALLISEEATRYVDVAGERVSQRSSESERK